MNVIQCVFHAMYNPSISKWLIIKPDTSFKSTSILTNNKAMISAKYYFKRGTYTQVFTYFYNNGKLIITENNEGAISEQEFYCK